MYAAFASIKLLESCQHTDAGFGTSVDVFHLALLAQLALQMKKVGARQEHPVSVAATFGQVNSSYQ